MRLEGFPGLPTESQNLKSQNASSSFPQHSDRPSNYCVNARTQIMNRILHTTQTILWVNALTQIPNSDQGEHCIDEASAVWASAKRKTSSPCPLVPSLAHSFASRSRTKRNDFLIGLTPPTSNLTEPASKRFSCRRRVLNSKLIVSDPMADTISKKSVVKGY